MNTISTFAALDEFLDRVESLNDDDRMRAEWAALVIDPDLWGSYPARLKNMDPFSAEYARTVKEFFRHMQGREYDIVNEVLDIDIDFMCNVGYPYSTRSPATVGGFLIAYGFIIRTMGLPVPSKILDIGSGAGSLTIHLAKMGYDMTCVDVNPQFTELLIRLTAGLPNPVRCLCGDISSIALEGEYDAILFMESLHHLLGHRETLKRLQSHLKKGGKFVFAAEPVVQADFPFVPYPWGPRLDGESVRAIRKHGWIELGFTEQYFDGMLRRMGLSSRRFRSAEAWWADVIVTRPLLSVERGERIAFAAGGRGVETLGRGWSEPEPFGVWSCEDQSIIRFGLNGVEKGPAEIKLSFLVFLAPGGSSQVIEIWVNDERHGEWRFKGKRLEAVQRSVFVDPGQLDEYGSVDLRFHISSPRSPKDLGISEDSRSLGIALLELVAVF